MQGVKKIAMVIIMQNDLAAAIDFYKKLGLTLVFQVKDTWAEFKINGLALGLCPTAEKIHFNRTGIVLEVEDLHAFYQGHQKELNFLDTPSNAAHGIIASIQDPSGNIVDLYQPTPEKIKELAHKMQMVNAGCCKESAQRGDSCGKQEKISRCC